MRKKQQADPEATMAMAKADNPRLVSVVIIGLARSIATPISISAAATAKCTCKMPKV
jgi:hypothetical protein